MGEGRCRLTVGEGRAIAEEEALGESPWRQSRVLFSSELSEGGGTSSCGCSIVCSLAESPAKVRRLRAVAKEGQRELLATMSWR